MKRKKIMEIVAKVVSKQMLDTTVQTFRDELTNVAVIGILEAAKKGGLTPEKVGVIAKREIINFKLGGWSSTSVPKGSRNYLRRGERLKANANVEVETLGTEKARWEKLKTLRMTIARYKAKKEGYKYLLIEKLLDGLTTHAAWQEIWDDYGQCVGLDAMYDIAREVADELSSLLNIKKRRQK